MKRPTPVVIDFETESIESRPKYPPVPVGVAIEYPGKKAKYLAWGHPEGNNTDKRAASRELQDIVRSGVPMLFHNAKFDVDVMQSHMGVKHIDWERIHDTMYLLFLNDPHARQLSLKPSAERILGEAPTERDALHDWLVEHKIIPRNKKDGGAFISKAPVSIVAPYACGDTGRTRRLFTPLWQSVINDCGMLEAYDRERELMPLLLANEREGMRIDVALLEADIAMYRKALNKVDAWIRKVLNAPGMNIDSDRELAKALRESGVVTNFVTTESGQDSVAKKNLTPGMFNDPRVARALGYRNRLTTCLGTFMEPWYEVASVSGGTIHTNWNQVRQTRDAGGGAGARTGRMSTNPNFQNIPKAWEGKNDGYEHPKHLNVPPLPLIRRYVLPDSAGHLFCHRDYNQQELRILGHFEDAQLLGAYRENPLLDVHDFVRDLIKEVTGLELQRSAVKALNFGMIYGMGAGALAENLDVDMAFSKKIRGAHQRALPAVKQLENDLKKIGKDGEAIRTWGGRMYYVEPPTLINGRMVTWEYKLLNYLIQGSAADCTKQAVINYSKVRRDGRFMVTVHDEINMSVPKKAVKSEMRLLRDAMQSVAFDVPMISNGKTGPRWGELVEFKEAA